MKKVMMGNHALSYGAMLSRVAGHRRLPHHPADPGRRAALRDVRRRDARRPSSSRSSPSTRPWPPASAPPSAGARAFTATSAQGLALMHEMLHWAAGGAPAHRHGQHQPRPWRRGWIDLDRPERHACRSATPAGCSSTAQSNQEVLDTRDPWPSRSPRRS
ncbi:MAG: hypothetical protein MZU95_01480 [Desulfomicrobium escambiense]|nr:hypothetical protein [Desulfomicrobium escambiense]